MNLDIQLEILGYFAGFLIIISLIPQLVVIIKNKTSHNVSFGMYIISLISQILWCVYSVLKNDMQLLATNIGTLTITIMILSFTLYYKIHNDYQVKINASSSNYVTNIC